MAPVPACLLDAIDSGKIRIRVGKRNPAGNADGDAGWRLWDRYPVSFGDGMVRQGEFIELAPKDLEAFLLEARRRNLRLDANRYYFNNLYFDLSTASPAAGQGSSQPAASTAPAAAPASATQPATQPAAVWSKAVDGLQGRIVPVRKSIMNGTAMIEAYIELRNVSDKPLAVAWSTAQTKFRVADSQGKAPLRPSSIVYDGQAWRKEDLLIPPGGAVSLDASTNGAGVGADLGGYLCLGCDYCWEFKLADKEYSLSATMEIVDKPAKPD